MEAVRIIKEMRNATKQLSVCGANDNSRVFPRIAIWENVPGAFSSNGGEDFRCVLEELARIENPEVSIPKFKKWLPCGCIELPHGTITWRTHDAQYWGVPQRRKRISLIVDFRDKPEPEIQFVSDSVSRNTATGEDKGQTITGTTGESFDTAISFQERGGKPGGVKESSYKTTTPEHCPPSATKLYCNSSGEEVSGTLDASYYKGCGTRRGHEREVVCVGNGQLAQAELSEKVGALNCMHEQQAIILLESNQNHATIQTDGISTALPASMGMGGGYVPMVVDQDGGKSQANVSVDLSPTLTTTHGGEPAVCQEVFSNVHAALNADDFSESDVSYTLNAVEHHAVCVGVDAYNQATTGDKTKTLNSVRSDSDHVPCVCYGLDRASFNQGKNAKFDISIQEDIAQPIVARGPGGG
jgi:DNA (cytosine-5)-methyltransferase 1